jgi:hypothetical protein
MVNVNFLPFPGRLPVHVLAFRAIGKHRADVKSEMTLASREKHPHYFRLLKIAENGSRNYVAPAVGEAMDDKPKRSKQFSLAICLHNSIFQTQHAYGMINIQKIS